MIIACNDRLFLVFLYFCGLFDPGDSGRELQLTKLSKTLCKTMKFTLCL